MGSLPTGSDKLLEIQSGETYVVIKSKNSHPNLTNKSILQQPSELRVTGVDVTSVKIFGEEKIVADNGAVGASFYNIHTSPLFFEQTDYEVIVKSRDGKSVSLWHENYSIRDKIKVSDMTANIIKWQLIQYTIEQCALHNIPLIENVPSGMYWDSERRIWDNCYVPRLVIDGKPILLVPKRIVSYTDKYTSNEYRQHFVLNYLQNENLQLHSALVRKRNDGTEYVTKKSITDTTQDMDKEYLARFTEHHPEVFSDFKEKTKSKIRMLPGSALDEINATEVCQHLIGKLQGIPLGKDHATDYHNLIVGILELLLYPNLSAPKKEFPIHDGRKRIDITYNNSAENGFFFTLPNSNPALSCPYVFVECKNYTGEVKNPELDQLSGRFSPRRGRVGILACRTLDSKNDFIKRCADTYHDDRGLILPICDEDIICALQNFPALQTSALENILDEKYRIIIMLK